LATIWDYRSRVGRRAARSARGGWTRQVVCEGVPADLAEDLVPDDWELYPGTSGQGAPRLIEAQVDRDWRPADDDAQGYARVVLNYRPLTFDEYLESNPNHGIILARSGASTIRANSYEDGGTRYILDGLDYTDTTGKTKWEIERGDAVRFEPQPILELYACTDNRDIFVFPYLSKVGSYNSGNMYNFPLTPVSSAEGRFLLTELSCVPRPTASRLFTVRYLFAVSLTGWDAATIAREYDLELVEVADTGETTVRLVPTWVPTTTTRSKVLVSSANFTVLDNMVVSSW